MLSQIVTLEQLHISTGSRSVRGHSWLINHGIVREALQPLRQLKILAISRDSYNPGFPSEALTKDKLQGHIDRYYLDNFPKSVVLSMTAGLSPDHLYEDSDSDAEIQYDYDHNQDQDDKDQESYGLSAEDRHSEDDHDIFQSDKYFDNDESTNEELESVNEAQDDQHKFQPGEDNDSGEFTAETEEISDEDQDSSDNGHQIQEQAILGTAESIIESYDSDGNSDEMHETWEREHAHRMQKHAKRYFESFPQLEHLYIGQLPIKRGLRLDSGRDDCYTWLGRTFGWPYECAN